MHLALPGNLGTLTNNNGISNAVVKGPPVNKMRNKFKQIM